MELVIKQEQAFQYIEEGEGEVLLLLHGLFGALSNFSDLVSSFSGRYKLVVPILPIYSLPIAETNLPSLTQFVHSFVQFKGFEQFVLLGNSLGGHISLLYAKQFQQELKALILTGSSGLFENAMGDTFPQRKNYDYIKEKTEYTFYDPRTASKELVDEVFGIVNDRERAMRVVAMAKSAIRNNMADDLPNIKIPTLLIWGNEDRVTPPFVADDFKRLLPNAELHFIPQCGHAPMMEQPETFNQILAQFLDKL